MAISARELNFALITDAKFPTRTGTFTTRDTTPDLTFFRGLEGSWDNHQENLGSDHYIIEVILSTQSPPLMTYAYVDGDLFRQLRKEASIDGASYEELLVQLKAAIKKATKAVSIDIEVPKVDSKVAHMLEAKNSLVTRWKAQRFNRRLRAKIAQVNRDIETYVQLSRQQWDEACSETDGRMRRGGKWKLLKSILNDKLSRGTANLAANKLVNKQIAIYGV